MLTVHSKSHILYVWRKASPNQLCWRFVAFNWAVKTFIEDICCIDDKGWRLNVVCLWETHRRVTEHHLPYEIAQRYLPLLSQASRYSICQPRRDGRLSWPWCWLYTQMVYLSEDSQPSNW